MARNKNPLQQRRRASNPIADADFDAASRWQAWVEQLEPADPAWIETNNYNDFQTLWLNANKPSLLLSSAQIAWPHRFNAGLILIIRRDWMRSMLLGEKSKADFTKVLRDKLPDDLVQAYQELSIGFPTGAEELKQLNNKREGFTQASMQALKLQERLKPLNAEATWRNQMTCHLAGWRVLALALAPIAQTPEDNCAALIRYGQALQELSLRLDGYLPADSPRQKQKLKQHIERDLHKNLSNTLRALMPKDF